MRLRIASELHAAPGWVPIVPDSSTAAAFHIDVVAWVTPRPDSHEIARQLVEAVNASSPLASHQGNCK